MKTTNLVRILGRILLQAVVPVILMELFIFVMIKTVSPESSPQQCISMMLADYIINAGIVIVITTVLFGCWFHLMSPHRFTNRKPKGLYREYITWFLREE